MRCFHEWGYSVLGVDRNAPPDDRLIQSDVAFEAVNLPDARFRSLLREFRPELVIHAAGCAMVGESLRDPLGDFHCNVEATAFVLDQIRRTVPTARVALFSSAAVYGNPQTLPIAESFPLQPLSPYGYHKWQCELLADEYAQLFEMRILVLRIFSAYGEGLRRQVVYDLCRKLRQVTDKIEILGTGKETRDFIHGRDVALAIRVLHESNSTGVFNVGSGEGTSIARLFGILADVLGAGKQARYTGKVRTGDALRWTADIGRLRALGFEPTVFFEAGIRRYAEWFLAQEAAVVDS
ncbi:NAD-dependent epimerase/dehydratase family protein [bacterium]|nr:NAD-dependent epimerase/dehydratase family protein [bacterium]MBU1985169.1 NAD-dependent epimerase/dehydratase family protein [bacterium]